MVNKPRSGSVGPRGVPGGPPVTCWSHFGHFWEVPKKRFFEVFTLRNVGFWGSFSINLYKYFSEISEIFGQKINKMAQNQLLKKVEKNANFWFSIFRFFHFSVFFFKRYSQGRIFFLKKKIKLGNLEFFRGRFSRSDS